MTEVNRNEIDLTLAIQLQAQFEEELRSQRIEEEKKIKSLKEVGHKWNPKSKDLSEPEQEKLSVSLVDPNWELLDPNPNIFDLFLTFNHQFFWGRLMGVEVKWSPRMTLCAGVCSYEGRGGLCSVRVSTPLLKLRPRKDLIETLLHEMIHAYLFVTHNNTDHDGHGPQFHTHMYRINKLAGTSISVYHSFHNEVKAYRQHVWKCNGPCTRQPPYFGLVKRSMNRAPSPRDPWWPKHAFSCGGTYVKIKEPAGYGEKKQGKKKEEEDSLGNGVKNKSKKEDPYAKDIRTFFPVNGGHKLKSVDSSRGKENVGLSGPSKPLGGNIKGYISSSDADRKGKVGEVGVKNPSNASVHGFDKSVQPKKGFDSGKKGVYGDSKSGNKGVYGDSKSGNKGVYGKGITATSGSVGSTTTVINSKKTASQIAEQSLPTEGPSFSAFSGAGHSLASSRSSNPGRSRLLSQFDTGKRRREEIGSYSEATLNSRESFNSSKIYMKSDSTVTSQNRLNSSKIYNKSDSTFASEDSFNRPSNKVCKNLDSASQRLVEDVDPVVCPMCQVPIKSSEFEDHLTVCLGDFDDQDFDIDLTEYPTATATATATSDRNIDLGGSSLKNLCSNTGSDTVLPSTSKHKAVIDLDSSVIELFDDDDEILIESVIKAENSDKNETKISNKNGNKQNLFPCPICKESYSETEINSHVNQHF